MGKVEIKIRKKILTPDNVQQYRNYPALLKKYKHNKRYRRALRIFLYSLALTAFVLGLVFISLWKIMLDTHQPGIVQSGVFKYLKSSTVKNDTITLELLSNQTTDDFYRVTYKGVNGRPDDLFEFPKDAYSNGKTTYRFIAEKKITVNNQEYTVKKYIYDVPNPAYSAFYFYTPEFGILIFASSWHENFYLQDIGNANTNRIVTSLIDGIKADPEFNYY